MRILIVEDDLCLAQNLSEALHQERFLCDHVTAAQPALQALDLTPYDLAIIDLGLPDMDGLELIRSVRQRGHTLPLLILTARDGLQDRVAGLDRGADDYLIKPFLLPELLARLRALIRRSGSAGQARLVFGPLLLQPETHQATLQGETLELTGREWGVLELLLLASPKVVSKQRLAEGLSRWDKEITDNAIEIYVSRLRNKLQGRGIGIRTVRGIGYRLEEGADA